MSFNKLMKTVDKFEKSPAPGVFDISSQLLPVNEVVKNILIMENNLPKEDAELMVDGFVNTPSSPSVPSSNPNVTNLKKKSKTQNELEKLKKEGDTKFKSKMIDDSVKDNIKIVSDTDTGAPLSSKSPYHKKAKEILALIKEKVTQFFRKVKELIMEIGATVVSIVSAIPGAALMVSPFAFNVPGMITMLMQMINLLSMLASKVADLTSFFKYFKMLPLVLPPSSLNSVSSLINTSYQSVSLAFKPLESGISSFLSSSKNTIKSKSKGDKIPRYITSRLRRAKYIRWVTASSFNFQLIGNNPIIPVNPLEIAKLLKDEKNKTIRVGGTYIPREELLKRLSNQVGGSVIKKELLSNNLNGYVIDKDFKNVSEDDLEEVEDILENWDVVFLNNRKVAVRQKKILDSEGKEVTMDKLLDGLDKIESLLDNIKTNLPESTGDDEFIYDVKFSDGRTLFGITRQEVDGLEVTYNVIYSENVKYSFI
jgi:hypothetical protein